MAIYRHELESLVSWANQLQRKPLIIRGARQVGKSTLVKLLAETANLNLASLNFERQPELAELFTSNNPEKILQFLQLQIQQPIIPGKSLLFLDEIQVAANILLPALRYFYEEMPNLHVIAAGSLLDFALADANFPMPVGRIEYLFLGPLRFEEFILALGEQPLNDFLNNYQLGDELPTTIHQHLMELLRSYMIIGGMPEAVAAFADKRAYSNADRIKHSILNTYQDDFAKYSTPTHENRLRKVFNSLPALVGNKLKYSHISPDQKSTTLAKALENLCLARVVYLVKHSACNGLPLEAEVNEKIFKPLLLDGAAWHREK